MTITANPFWSAAIQIAAFFLRRSRFGTVFHGYQHFLKRLHGEDQDGSTAKIKNIQSVSL